MHRREHHGRGAQCPGGDPICYSVTLSFAKVSRDVNEFKEGPCVCEWVCHGVYVFCVSVLQKRAAWGQSHKNRAAQAQCAKNCSIGGPWLLETEWIGFSNFFLVWTRMQNLGKSTRCMAKSRLASKCNIFEAWPEKDVFFGLLWISPVSVCPPVSVWPLRWLTRDLSIADTWGNQLTCHFLPIELYNWL